MGEGGDTQHERLKRVDVTIQMPLKEVKVSEDGIAYHHQTRAGVDGELRYDHGKDKTAITSPSAPTAWPIPYNTEQSPSGRRHLRPFSHVPCAI